MNRRTAIQGLLGGIAALFVGRRAEASPVQETFVWSVGGPPTAEVEFSPRPAEEITDPRWSLHPLTGCDDGLWVLETASPVPYDDTSRHAEACEVYQRHTEACRSSQPIHNVHLGRVHVVSGEIRTDGVRLREGGGFEKPGPHETISIRIVLRRPCQNLDTATGEGLDELARRMHVRRLPLDDQRGWAQGGPAMESDRQLRARLRYLKWLETPEGRWYESDPNGWHRLRSLI